ncbi:MAG: hypothetical protein QNJ87_09605 [Gammaproteobacteria bacterium]|nr:hypothetical protein [Gammaproteobacteria bacterium]
MTRCAAVEQMLPARAQLMHLIGLLAGKWPHGLTIQPGGTIRSVEVQERMRIGSILVGFCRFLDTVLLGDVLEAMLAPDSPEGLLAFDPCMVCTVH